MRDVETLVQQPKYKIIDHVTPWSLLANQKYRLAATAASVVVGSIQSDSQPTAPSLIRQGGSTYEGHE